MSPDELLAHYPFLYHMAEAGTWPSMTERGLLSTSALLDLFEITGAQRHEIESKRRRTTVEIHHPIHGTAVIRDQIPLSDVALRKCLIDMTPQEWYETLNRRVFFWLTRERLRRLLSARAYRDREHCVLTLDTRRLVNRQLDRITLSPINSGSTVYKAQPRGRNTFFPVQEYPFEERRRTRTIENAVAELVVEYAVPDIVDLTVKVVHMVSDRVLETLYEE